MSFKRFIRFPEHDEKHDEQMTRYLRFISVVKPVGTMKGWGWGTSKGFQYPAVPLSRCACARLFRINWRPVSPASLSRRSLLPYRYKNVRTVFFPSSHPTNFSHLPTFLLYIAPSPLQGLRPSHCPRLPRIIALGFSTLHLLHASSFSFSLSLPPSPPPAFFFSRSDLFAVLGPLSHHLTTFPPVPPVLLLTATAAAIFTRISLLRLRTFRNFTNLNRNAVV